MSPLIPAELIEDILDELTDDQETLRNCSLVCHSWNSSAKSRLFAQATVRNGHSLEHALEKISVVGPYIRSLTLYGGYNTGGWFDEVAMKLPYESMTRVDTLKMESFIVHSLNRQNVTTILFPLFIRVRHLLLLNIRFPSDQGAMEWISASRSLRSLTLRSVTWGSSWNAAAASGNPMPREGYLPPEIGSFTMSDTDDILDWISASKPGISSLNVPYFYDSSSFFTFCRNIAPSLISLELHFDFVLSIHRDMVRTTPDTRKTWNFLHCTQLRTLRITDVSARRTSLVWSLKGPIAPILKGIAFRNLSSVTLKFETSEKLDWDDVEDLLAITSQWQSTRIEFLFPKEDGFETVFETLRGLLSKLDLEGRLILRTFSS